MKTKFKNLEKLKVNFLMGAMVLSLFAVGQTQTTKSPVFKDWDSNGDKNITKSEFGDRYSKDYTNHWRGNSDAMNNGKVDKKSSQSDLQTANKVANALNDEAFYRSSYKVWDTNRDQRLGEDEWKYGFDSSYKNFVKGDYKSLDKNADGNLDYDEYHNSLRNTDYYLKYDMDKNKGLDDTEISNMVFDNWDFDKNNSIDENEYKKYQRNYMDFNNSTDKPVKSK